MTEWCETTLGEVITLQRGFDLTEKQSTPGAYPVISSSGTAYTTDFAKVEGPGVITGRKGLLGKVHYSTLPYWPHDTTLWVKDFKGADPRFIYYLLQTLPLAALDAGASNPTLNRNHAHLLPVRIPDHGTQHAIATVLQTLDDLIDNNRRRVAILDEMMRTIYRDWFVNFRFPGHEEVNFVDSDLGHIPDGWTPTTVGQLSEAVTRGIAPKYAIDGPWTVLNQRCIRDGRVSLEAARQQERDVPVSKQVSFGDVLINSTGVGTLGRVALYIGHEDTLTVDSHVTIVRPADKATIPWFGMSLCANQPTFESLGTGSTGQTELSRADIGAVVLAEPPMSLRALFTEAAWPLLHMVPAMLDCNLKLTVMRDMLLPRLVAGQVEVSSLDLDVLLEGSVA